MNKPDLAPYNWQVPIGFENPLSAPQSTQEFPIASKKHIAVTNLFSGKRVDTWVVWEVVEEGIAGLSLAHMRFISSSFTQTSALETARMYAWSVYRVDITEGGLPF
jgi:hypothetical protein